jgi:hypothetical protein
VSLSLDVAAVLLASSALVASLALMKDRDILQATGRPSRRSLLVYAGLIVLGTLVSLAAFDSFGNHAFQSHEDQMLDAFKGALTQQMSSPLEVPVLARMVYSSVGGLVTAGSDPLPLFVCLAILWGAFGGLLAGFATSILTRKPWTGWLVALLMVFHPTLAYWRVHAYPIAFSHAVFCATLLAAALVVRAPTRRAFLAWFLLGALTTFLRIESAGPVIATAALPLLCGQHRMLKEFRVWLPPLLLAAGLLAFPLAELFQLIEEREDYRVGLRFLALHLPLWDVYAPLNEPSLLLIFTVGAASVFVPHAHAPQARGLLTITLLSLFPSILFVDFGPRHALPATTAGLMLCAVTASQLVPSSQLRQNIFGLGLATLVLLSSINVWETLSELGTRYGLSQDDDVTGIPGLERPRNPMPDGWERCAIYSDLMYVCETYRETCHPIKDELGGCVLLGVDVRSAAVRGIQHESWPIVEQLYPLTPFGRLQLPPKDQWEPYVDFYKLEERP